MFVVHGEIGIRYRKYMMCLGESPSGENFVFFFFCRGARNSTLGLADRDLASTSLFKCNTA